MYVQAYRRQVETASPLPILVALYREALRRIELGAAEIEAGRGTEAAAHFNHAREVLMELMVALTPVEGAEQLVISLGRLYHWSIAELIACGRERDAVRARRVGQVLMPLLDGFNEVLLKGLA